MFPGNLANLAKDLYLSSQHDLMLSGPSIHQKRPSVYGFNHLDDNGIVPTTKDYQRVLSEIELYNSTVDECDVVSRVKADQLAAMMDSVSLNTDERI